MFHPQEAGTGTDNNWQDLMAHGTSARGVGGCGGSSTNNRESEGDENSALRRRRRPSSSSDESSLGFDVTGAGANRDSANRSPTDNVATTTTTTATTTATTSTTTTNNTSSSSSSGGVGGSSSSSSGGSALSTLLGSKSLLGWGYYLFTLPFRITFSSLSSIFLFVYRIVYPYPRRCEYCNAHTHIPVGMYS